MHNNCKKCGSEMRAGKYIQQTYEWHSDFAGDKPGDRGQTISAGGTGKLSDCLKCVECGWSVDRAG